MGTKEAIAAMRGRRVSGASLEKASQPEVETTNETPAVPVSRPKKVSKKPVTGGKEK